MGGRKKGGREGGKKEEGRRRREEREGERREGGRVEEREITVKYNIIVLHVECQASPIHMKVLAQGWEEAY